MALYQRQKASGYQASNWFPLDSVYKLGVCSDLNLQCSSLAYFSFSFMTVPFTLQKYSVLGQKVTVRSHVL